MIEETWTWPRYQKMQDHWQEWGPPTYILVAGYFGMGRAAKKKRKLTPQTAGADVVEKLQEEGRGDLRDLMQIFKGGVIR